MVLFSLAECYRTKGNFCRCSALAGVLLALVLIPVLYYTYTGILGVSVDWFNVTIFFLAAGVAYYLEYRLEAGRCHCQISTTVWGCTILLISAVFTAATFFPPHIPLFRDPVTGSYGIHNAMLKAAGNGYF